MCKQRRCVLCVQPRNLFKGHMYVMYRCNASYIIVTSSNTHINCIPLITGYNLVLSILFDLQHIKLL